MDGENADDGRDEFRCGSLEIKIRERKNKFQNAFIML